MPTLECPGVFSLVLPEGWSVTGEHGKRYELLRPSHSSGALHISIYQRNGTPVTEAEAHDLLSRFLDNLTVTDGGEVLILAESDAQHRAVSRSRTLDPESGNEFGVLAFLVLWKSHFLICTCTDEPDSPLLDEAEQLFASIAPAESSHRRRNIGRRR